MQFPPLTIKLLWATVVCLLVPLVLPPGLLAQLALWPLVLDASGIGGGNADIGFMPWQLVTHALILTGPGDLLFVGLTLAFFGSSLELMWGQRRYGLFLLACAAASGLVQLGLLTLGYQAGVLGFAPVAGANGLMFGVLFACAYLNPTQPVRLIIPPVEMQMQTLVLAFSAIELALGLFYGSGLISFGFLGGMLGAWLHIRYWRGEPPFGRGRKPPPPKKNHLRSVN